MADRPHDTTDADPDAGTVGVAGAGGHARGAARFTASRLRANANISQHVATLRSKAEGDGVAVKARLDLALDKIIVSGLAEEEVRQLGPVLRAITLRARLAVLGVRRAAGGPAPDSGPGDDRGGGPDGGPDGGSGANPGERRADGPGDGSGRPLPEWVPPGASMGAARRRRAAGIGARRRQRSESARIASRRTPRGDSR